MPIINSAFLPPSPLLLPDIGKENSKILHKTSSAYQYIANLFEEAEIETIIIISQQNPYPSQRIAINVSSNLKLDFKDFGHIAENRTCSLALNLADNIHQAIGCHRAIRMISSENLDYGSAIPLYMLGDQFKKIKILPIYISPILNKQDHYNIGITIKESLQVRTEKIAIIASGSLSNKLKKSSPDGYSPKGARFDNKLIEYLSKAEDSAEKIINIEEALADEVGDKSLKQLSMLLGIIGNTYQNKILAYQNDFGIGYLSMYFDLQVAQI